MKMGNKREDILKQVLELEERRDSSQQRRENLSRRDQELQERFSRLHRQQRDLSELLSLSLEEKESAIWDILELMSQQRNECQKQKEEMQQEQQKVQQGQEEKVSTEISHLELRFKEEKQQLLSQITELEQQLEEQKQLHQSTLESVRKREEQRKERQLNKLISDKEKEGELQVKAALLQLREEERVQHDDCFIKAKALIKENQHLWTKIDDIKDLQIKKQKDMVCWKFKLHKNYSANSILEQEIKTLSTRMRQLNLHMSSLNHQKQVSQEQTDALSGELFQNAQELKEQTAEMKCLRSELKEMQSGRKRMESSMKKALVLLGTVMKDPQKDTEMVQKLADVFKSSSWDVTDSEFSEYTVRYFYGPEASEERVREESHRVMKMLTDPNFLLKCPRRSGVSFWPSSTWDQHD